MTTRTARHGGYRASHQPPPYVLVSRLLIAASVLIVMGLAVVGQR
jgi:hypothetical protein